MSINFTFYKIIDLYLHSKKHFVLKPVLKNVCIFLTYANVNLTLIVFI